MSQNIIHAAEEWLNHRYDDEKNETGITHVRKLLGLLADDGPQDVQEQEPEAEGQLYGNAAAEVLDQAFEMQEFFRKYGMSEERQMVEAEHVATGLVHAKQAVKVQFEMEPKEFMIWWFEQIGEELPKPTDAMSTFTRQFLQKGCEIYLTQHKTASMNVQVQFMQQLAKEAEEAAKEAEEAAKEGAGEDEECHDPALETEGEVVLDDDGKFKIVKGLTEAEVENNEASESEEERTTMMQLAKAEAAENEVTDVPLDEEEPIETEDESET